MVGRGNERGASTVPPLLRVDGLETQFATAAETVRAVDGVSFAIDRGEVLGLVGESGCGKTVTSLSIMRLVPPPGRIAAGRILLAGEDLLAKDAEAMRRVRGARIAMVFQEPMTSLNPVFSIGDQIAAAVRAHAGGGSRAAWDRAVEMLDRVQVPAPRQRAPSSSSPTSPRRRSTSPSRPRSSISCGGCRRSAAWRCS
jgi:peptide/nickel transport system ATP-binding protein/oligopeptide transport system ATP-binding protein